MISVTASVAMSLDGCIDDASDKRLLLSNDLDFAAVDRLRAESDAILVGAETLRSDNPRLMIRDTSLQSARVAAGQAGNPIKVTLTRSGTLDPKLNFFAAGDGLKVVYCPANIAVELTQRIGGLATVVGYPAEECFASFILQDLEQRGTRKLLIEGGEHIHTAFLMANLVDELRVAVAPFFVGDKNAPRFVGPGAFTHNFLCRMNLRSVEQCGDMAILRYSLR